MAITKIEKLANGGVLLLDVNGNIRGSFKGTERVFPHPRLNDYITITQETTAQNEHAGTSFKFGDITHTIVGSSETAVSGNMNDFIRFLANNFFNKGGDSGAGAVDFTGRWYCFTDNRWVGTTERQGIGSGNYDQSAGTGVTPGVSFRTLGLGFLKAGTVLKNLEFVGRVDNAEVTDVEIYVRKQGVDFDGSGYSSHATSSDVVILGTTALKKVGVDMTNTQRWSVDLSNHVLTSDRIITLHIRPVGTLTDTRYFSVNAKLNYLKS